MRAAIVLFVTETMTLTGARPVPESLTVPARALLDSIERPAVRITAARPTNDLARFAVQLSRHWPAAWKHVGDAVADVEGATLTGEPPVGGTIHFVVVDRDTMRVAAVGWPVLEHRTEAAAALARAVNRVRENLESAASAIASAQRAFLCGDQPAPAPLTADSVGHPVLVRRMLEPGLPIRFAGKTFDARELVVAPRPWAERIAEHQDAVAEILAAEDPTRPHSDAAIVRLLDERGTKIARRTVAKCREALGVLSSSKRKREL